MTGTTKKWGRNHIEVKIREAKKAYYVQIKKKSKLSCVLKLKTANIKTILKKTLNKNQNYCNCNYNYYLFVKNIRQEDQCQRSLSLYISGHKLSVNLSTKSSLFSLYINSLFHSIP